LIIGWVLSQLESWFFGMGFGLGHSKLLSGQSGLGNSIELLLLFDLRNPLHEGEGRENQTTG